MNSRPQGTPLVDHQEHICSVSQLVELSNAVQPPSRRLRRYPGLELLQTDRSVAIEGGLLAVKESSCPSKAAGGLLPRWALPI